MNRWTSQEAAGPGGRSVRYDMEGVDAAPSLGKVKPDEPTGGEICRHVWFRHIAPADLRPGAERAWRRDRPAARSRAENTPISGPSEKGVRTVRISCRW